MDAGAMSMHPGSTGMGGAGARMCARAGRREQARGEQRQRGKEHPHASDHRLHTITVGRALRRDAAQPFAGPLGSKRICAGAFRIRISFAGTPPTTALSGTSAVTTELVPITQFSPTAAPRSTQAP